MSIWYLGPLGDLRPLVCPDPDISIDQVRYGGIHQGLSGARTVDVTGHSSEFTFDFGYLNQAEYRWLEALHTRLVPGPHWLINPLKKNRLTLQASKLQVRRHSRTGVRIPEDGLFATSSAYPNAVGLPGRSVRVAAWSGSSAAVEFDWGKPVPVLPGELISASVYLAAGAGTTALGATLSVAWYDAGGAPLSPTVSDASDLPDVWGRYELAGLTPPAGAASCQFSVNLTTSDAPVYFAAPQLEVGPEVTEFETGGAAVQVSIDQLPTESPRFPLRNATLTLVET